MVLYDALDSIDVEKVVQYVSNLQTDDGSFTGDKYGEIDTRFSFCATATLALLVRCDAFTSITWLFLSMYVNFYHFRANLNV